MEAIYEKGSVELNPYRQDGLPYKVCLPEHPKEDFPTINRAEEVLLKYRQNEHPLTTQCEPFEVYSKVREVIDSSSLLKREGVVYCNGEKYTGDFWHIEISHVEFFWEWDVYFSAYPVTWAGTYERPFHAVMYLHTSLSFYPRDHEGTSQVLRICEKHKGLFTDLQEVVSTISRSFGHLYYRIP